MFPPPNPWGERFRGWGRLTFQTSVRKFLIGCAAVSKLLTCRRFNADIHKSTGYSTMTPPKTWISKNFWLDLEISEAF